MPKSRINKGETTFLERMKQEEENQRSTQENLCRKTLKEFYDMCNTDENRKLNILGRRLYWIREINATTRYRLEKRSNIHRSTIGHIEDGDYKSLPFFETIFSIFQALDFDYNEFVSMPDDTDGWIKKLQDKYGYFDPPELETLLPYEHPERHIDNVKTELFEILEKSYIYYEKDGTKKKIPDEHLEFLMRNIYNSFELLEKLL